MLAGCGYDITAEACSVADALRQTSVRMPDALLVDVGLPDGDGLELARQLTASQAVRVVLVSADPDSLSQDDARAAGALGFVPKIDLSCAVLHLLLDTN
ncbi:response regulator [Leifsonia sp. AG29]|uniref:response regulator n=1 Tax=Leifsonia sp. AG29 TaxID=2598860 RepID=UPI003FA3C893